MIVLVLMIYLQGTGQDDQDSSSTVHSLEMLDMLNNSPLSDRDGSPLEVRVEVTQGNDQKAENQQLKEKVQELQEEIQRLKKEMQEIKDVIEDVEAQGNDANGGQRAEEIDQNKIKEEAQENQKQEATKESKLVYPSTGFEIREKDGFLIYEYPSISLLNANSFTIELLYKTERQPNVTEEVAIYSNERCSPVERLQYGRFFRVFLIPEGRVRVDFSAGDFKTPTDTDNTHGEIRGEKIIDDNQWHHIAVIRDKVALKLFLYVDGIEEGSIHMPNGIDVEDQEQRTIIGGGNDRAFRHCFVDEVRFWKKVLKPTEFSIANRCLTQEDTVNPALVAYFPFDDYGDDYAVVVRDYSSYMGDALRTGAAKDKSSFVLGHEGFKQCKPLKRKLHQTPPYNETIIMTSVILPCSPDAVVDLFQAGHMYQLESYIGIFWLDVNRLNLMTFIFYACLPQSVIEQYSTPVVHFVDITEFRQSLTLECPPVNERFLIYEKYLSEKLSPSTKYVVQIDIRDSRVNHSPAAFWEANPDTNFVLQTVRNGQSTGCGGFQAAKVNEMLLLLSLMRGQMESSKCKKNDQNILIDIYNHNQLKKVKKDDLMINSQHTRVFDKITAFEHGNWWMTQQYAGTYNIKNVYVRGIP